MAREETREEFTCISAATLVEFACVSVGLSAEFTGSPDRGLPEDFTGGVSIGMSAYLSLFLSSACVAVTSSSSMGVTVK